MPIPSARPFAETSHTSSYHVTPGVPGIGPQQLTKVYTTTRALVSVRIGGVDPPPKVSVRVVGAGEYKTTLLQISEIGIGPHVQQTEIPCATRRALPKRIWLLREIRSARQAAFTHWETTLMLFADVDAAWVAV